MGAKAEIGWTCATEDGAKREVYCQRVGGDWRFFAREKRFEKWEPVPHPPLEDWLELLDAIRRRIVRRRHPPVEETRVKKMILDRYPGTNLD